MDNFRLAGQFLNLLLICLFMGIAPQKAHGLVSLSAICLECHEEEYDSTMESSQYIHAPYIKQQCYKCHINRDVPSAPGSGNDTFPDKVHWLDRHDQATSKHTFLIPDDQIDFTLYVEADLEKQLTYKKIIAVPALSSLPILENDRTAPQISDVRVEEIKRGLFLSATIAWKTDEPSSGQVFYGRNDTKSPSEVHTFSTEHRVTISPLKSKKNYQFFVVSKDWFNNESRSDISSFSTAQPVSSSPDDSYTDSDIMLELETRFRSLGDKYLVEISCSRPTTMTIGVNPVLSNTAPAEVPDDHPYLNDKQTTNVTICKGCHPSSFQENSHPINVRPRRGMLIPPEYPMLPDGRMSCMTCHARHGSNFEFRMIKSSKRELCIGCHKEFGKY
jgi:predicted CXXCH cytochrome family protein